MINKMRQFRFADLSLFQSAVDEVLARATAAKQADGGETPEITRPDLSNPSMLAAVSITELAEAAGKVHALPEALEDILPASALPPTAVAATTPTGAPAVCNQNPITYCASLARNYALAKLHGQTALADRYCAQLTKVGGVCDPHWVEAAVKYAEFIASRGTIPYRRWKKLSDYVIDGRLPSNARIGIVGDWGTGQPEAKTVLQQIARKKPNVVIHLGDIYYSATEFEVENYFYKIWQQILNLPGSGIATFTLAGNHDMFGGGAPYYKLIDQLGQPASYFCLRNENWQIIGLDTGYHDAKPEGGTPTFLEDTELQWLKDKIQNRGNRKTILLSHHQLFSAFEDICGAPVNQKLKDQLQDVLPEVDLWLWGHEHNQVIYKKYLGVLARCIGHGAFPIAVDEIPKHPKFAQIAVEDVHLGGDVFFNHGYAVVDLDGRNATVSYYEDADENKPVFKDTL